MNIEVILFASLIILSTGFAFMYEKIRQMRAHRKWNATAITEYPEPKKVFNISNAIKKALT